MRFFTVIGLMPRWIWTIAFMFSSLSPSFRAARVWAEELLDDTFTAITEGTDDFEDTSQYVHISVLEQLADQLSDDDAVGEANVIM